MQSRYVIEAGNPTPSIPEILALLNEYSEVMIKYVSLDAAYIHHLNRALTESYVSHLPWNNMLMITPAIADKEILKLRDEICECARSFRKDAMMLMQQMSCTFGVDKETLEGLHELKFEKSNKQRGELDDQWSYYLHGAECQFENTITKQIVEVIIITHPEFGCLDGYFFYNYMVTTDRYRTLAAALGNSGLNVHKAINLLAYVGLLQRLPHLARL